MFQRDYILRMIEMMGNLARRVAELMDQLEYLHQLDDESRLNCGLPLKALEELSEESLMDMLGPEPRLYASEILYLRAIEPNTYWDQKARLMLKSLRLLASLTEESLLCELRSPRLKELKQAVLSMMTVDDLLAVAGFFAEGGSFDEMEDALFQAVERSRSVAERIEVAKAGHVMLSYAAGAGEDTLAYCHMTAEELLDAAGDILRLAQETGE